MSGNVWSQGIVKTHTYGWVTHKQEDNYNCRGSLQGALGPSPRLAPYPRCPTLIKQATRTFGFEGQWVLISRKQEGSGKQTSLLQNAHKISHTLGLLIFKSLLERQEARGDHPRDIDTNDSHLGEQKWAHTSLEIPGPQFHPPSWLGRHTNSVIPKALKPETLGPGFTKQSASPNPRTSLTFHWAGTTCSIP